MTLLYEYRSLLFSFTTFVMCFNQHKSIFFHEQFQLLFLLQKLPFYYLSTVCKSILTCDKISKLSLLNLSSFSTFNLTIKSPFLPLFWPTDPLIYPKYFSCLHNLTFIKTTFLNFYFSEIFLNGLSST